MIDKDQYQRTFGVLHASGDFLKEETLMQSKKLVSPRRALCLCAAVILLFAMATVCYAADIGGIRRTVQIWVHGDQTSAVMDIQDGQYTLTYQDAEGKAHLLWPIAAAVLKNVGSDQDVEECVADAFIYLWEHPGNFDPTRGKLKTLLCVLTRSRAIDRYRELSRRNTIPLEEALCGGGLCAQEALAEEEIRSELRQLLQTLGELNREILVRRYYYDQKPREIALATGLTVTQVNNSLYRSKRQLRQGLTEKGVGV